MKPRLLLVLSLALLTGCGGEKLPMKPAAPPESPPVNVKPPSAESSGETKPGVPRPAERSGITHKVKVDSGDGAVAFSIKPKDNGAKVVDANEKELYRLKWEGDKIKVKSAADAVLGYIARTSSGQIKIVDASQKMLFKIVTQADGDMKVEDSENQLLYRVKKRDYGFEIETPPNESLYKVKSKDGKTSVRNAADKTVFSTHDPAPAAAFAAFGMDKIDRAFQCGLFLEMAGR